MKKICCCFCRRHPGINDSTEDNAPKVSLQRPLGKAAVIIGLPITQQPQGNRSEIVPERSIIVQEPAAQPINNTEVTISHCETHSANKRPSSNSAESPSQLFSCNDEKFGAKETISNPKKIEKRFTEDDILLAKNTEQQEITENIGSCSEVGAPTTSNGTQGDGELDVTKPDERQDRAEDISALLKNLKLNMEIVPSEITQAAIGDSSKGQFSVQPKLTMRYTDSLSYEHASIQTPEESTNINNDSDDDLESSSLDSEEPTFIDPIVSDKAAIEEFLQQRAGGRIQSESSANLHVLTDLPEICVGPPPARPQPNHAVSQWAFSDLNAVLEIQLERSGLAQGLQRTQFRSKD